MARRRHASSARVFAWMAGFFALAQLTGGWLIDNVYPHVRFPFAHSHFAELDKILAHGRSPDVIYLGTSRFNSCFHEGLLTKGLRTLTGDPNLLVFNGSGGGADPITSDYLLEEFLQRGARPSLAMVEVMPDTINHLNNNMSLHLFRQLKWSDMPAYFGEACRTGNLVPLVQDRLTPIYVHRFRVLKLLAIGAGWPILGPETGYPYRTWDGPWDAPVDVPQTVDARQLEDTHNGLARVSIALQEFRPGGNALKALERLMERCRQNDIAILFICPPVAAAHRRHYTPEIEAQFAVLLERLRQTPNCRVMDGRDRLPDTLFLDSHHANPNGMLYFSRQVCREILAPYCRDIHFASTEQEEAR